MNEHEKRKSKLLRLAIWGFVFSFIMGGWLIIAHYDEERALEMALPLAIVLSFVLIKAFYTPKWMQ